MGKTEAHIITTAKELRQNRLIVPTVYGAASSGKVTFFDRWLIRKLLEKIGKPSISFILWNDEEITSPEIKKPLARIRIRNRRALLKLLSNPELNFGDLYSIGVVDVEGDLPTSLVEIYRAIRKVDKNPVIIFLRNLFRQRNSPDKARRNIHHHYDIGNDFYKLWLDRAAMQYTCAYFSDPAMTIEEAQIAKMHHVCRKLQLKPGQTVVEAGCGWGGLGLFMAQEYGVNVKAYNISHEQIVYATQRAAETGMSNQVEYIEDDYRNITGEFDVFVSVGMLEHVGIDQYIALGNVIDRCLKPKGMGLIHSIGRNKPALLNEWIATRIFPGACPPSISQMMTIFEPKQFSVLDIENLRLHYAKTLEHWLARFDENAAQFRNTYDEEFIRAWRLYLAGSIAAFHSGTMQLFQIVFTRPQNNDLPWSRAHLYKDPPHA